MPGRVTPQERRLAHTLAHDFAQTIERGVDAAQQIGWRAMLAAWRAYARGADPVEAATDELDAMAPLLASAMLTAALTGIERGQKLMPVALSLAMPVSDVYRNAVAQLKQRTAMTDTALRELEKKLGTQALRVSRTAKAAVEKKLEKAMLRITEEGLHVRDGKKALREAFEAGGIVPGNAYMLESLYRTQSALAYAAGKVQVEQAPESQEILWGYKYVTVGDDRVRDSHIALDGVTLPKTDLFWQENYPPNGWACRCQAIPLYEQRSVVLPPGEVEINGRTVKPGADPGFRFNPGTLIEAGPSKTPTLPAVKPVLPKVTPPPRIVPTTPAGKMQAALEAAEPFHGRIAEFSAEIERLEKEFDAITPERKRLPSSCAKPKRSRASACRRP